MNDRPAYHLRKYDFNLRMGLLSGFKKEKLTLKHFNYTNMETTIDKNEARKLYPTAPDWLKLKFENDFGKDSFIPKTFETIKTLQDAYNAVPDAVKAIYDREHNTPGLSDDILADIEAKLIAKALQGAWKADFSNYNQQKWYPWFRFSAGSGFDFAVSHCGYDDKATSVGSRFCFSDEEIADYFGSQFIEIHRRRLTPKE